jgi:hypothetical protein
LWTEISKTGFPFRLSQLVMTPACRAPRQYEYDTLRMGTAGLGANKNREQRQCPPLSIFDLSQPVAALRLVIALISLPKKSFVD